jgi:putative RNA 2'-phosphotransferase
MGNPQPVERLGKFLDYVLGRRPDEFGLIPDPEGFVKTKELLKAINEEDGWGWVRQAALNEVTVTLPEPPVEIVGGRIRAADRSNLPARAPAMEMPTLLYTCVRRKAHPVVIKHGVSPLGGGESVVLAAEEEMAERLGRRIDAAPVKLTVNTDQCVNAGLMVEQYGEGLFLVDELPPHCFTAPPLPKEREDAKKADAPTAPAKPKTPGSFFVDIVDPEEKRHMKREQRKKDRKRDKDRRQQRRQKRGDWE